MQNINPFSTKLSPKKVLSLTWLNQFLGCHDAKLALVLLKTLKKRIFFPDRQISSRLGTKMQNAIWCTHTTQNLDFFLRFRDKFLSCLLSFRFSRPVYSISLLSVCHILSGCRKKFGVKVLNLGKAQKWDPDQLQV